MAWVNLNTIYATKSEVNSKVPNTRTINGKELSSNVTLGASDIKLSDDTTLQSAWDSISHTTISGTGWSAHKIGKLGIVYIGISTSISDGWSDTTIGMLPDGWKPSHEPTAPTALQASGNNDVVIRLFKDGSICITGKGTSWRSGWVFAVVPYIIA